MHVVYSPHEGVLFSIHSLNRTGSPYLHSSYNVCALIYHVCDHILFSIYSTTAHLYGAPLVSICWARLPKIIGPREGHAGKQHIIV